MLAEVIDVLEARGNPEAGDHNLICGQSHAGMVARILSIQLGEPVWYGHKNVAGVLNAIAQTQGVRRSETSVYLIAVRAYKPHLTERQKQWFEDWASEVRESLRRGESTYLRDPSYDRLLSLLFPEMAAMLAWPRGKRSLDDVPAHGDWQSANRMGLPVRQRATFLKSSPHDGLGRRRGQDPHSGGGWLVGEALEIWKLKNPEWARAWFGTEGDVSGRLRG